VRYLIAFFLCFSIKAWSTPLYSENFESYPLGQVVTYTAGANYRDGFGGSGSSTIVTFNGGQAAGLTASAWAHALYNNLTPSGAISFTARVDGSAGRANLCVYCTTIVAGLPTDGYQIQWINTNHLYFYRGGYSVLLNDTTTNVTPANPANFLLGIYKNASGSFIFMDGVQVLTATAEGFYNSGQIGFGTFADNMKYDDAYVDDTTPTPTPTNTPTSTPTLTPVPSGGPSKTKDKTHASALPIMSPTPIRSAYLRDSKWQP
jgi:hypothetical protein